MKILILPGILLIPLLILIKSWKDEGKILEISKYEWPITLLAVLLLVTLLISFAFCFELFLKGG